MTTPFVHLHVHSDYSLLDGAQSVKSIVSQAAAFGMPAVAITDHGSMSSAYELMQQSKKAKIKGIIGCEFYVTPGDYLDHESTPENKQRFHLVLLAENIEGYRNMCHLSEEAWLRGYYYKPRIDFKTLKKYHKGIICLSACLSGQLPKLLMANQVEEAEALAKQYLELFGPKNYYIELQDHGLADQKVVNPQLIALAKKLGIGLVVTNDAHYLRKEDADAQDIMVCVGTQTNINDPKRMLFGSKEFYFKSSEEMELLFPELPEAMSNTVEIAERCNVHLPTVDEDKANHYPEYPEPEGVDREAHFRQICKDGLMWRYNFDPDKDEITPERQVILDRMNYEIDIIKRMGFISYYLVVWDFLHYAASVGIPLGPGRGSGAGSLAAYLVGITHIDPLRYNLLFERFLNPERVSPPDFDIDLCERRRHEVIEYVRAKYGDERVVQIGTFGTLKAKQVVKDVARAMGRSFDEGAKFCKLIPAHPKMTLDIALNGSEKLGFPPNEELKNLIESEAWCKQLWEYAKTLEGLNRNMSIHAAGVIIGDMPVAEVAPIARGAGNEAITQFSAIPCESLGLLKMDFLGLKTLTLIQDALDLVEKNTGRKILSNDIPIDDKVTYDLLNQGKSIAVFQLESGGMQDLCRKWHLSRLEDIIALIAIYRPGPMEFIPEFLGRKEGRIPLDYDVPAMEPILAETFGIMLYQEHIMQVAQAVAGFTLGQADILRRAIGKKKLDVMKEMFIVFQEGCRKNGIKDEISQGIWDKILKFAGYGFNKSHSAAYGLLTYRTAWLKANYPAEFMAAVLTSEMANSEKMAFYLKECRAMNIQILAPDVNICGKHFSVDGKNIRFGLAAIKSVGEGIVQVIIDAREKEGPFKDMQDFCTRVPGVSKRLLEVLILSGSMDSFGKKRSQLLAVADEVVSRANAARKEKDSSQLSLFDMLGSEEQLPDEIQYPEIPEMDLTEMLAAEKSLMGFYISGHPIDAKRELIDKFQLDDLTELPQLPDQTIFRTGAYLSSVQCKISKKSQKPFAIITMESRESTMEAMVFSRELEALKENDPGAIESGAIVFVEGVVEQPDEEGGQVRLRINKLSSADRAPELYAGNVYLYLTEEQATTSNLEALAAICSKHAGAVPVTVCLKQPNGDCLYFRNPLLLVQTTPAFLEEVSALLDDNCYKIMGNKERPENKRRRTFHQNQVITNDD